MAGQLAEAEMSEDQMAGRLVHWVNWLELAGSDSLGHLVYCQLSWFTGSTGSQGQLAEN